MHCRIIFSLALAATLAPAQETVSYASIGGRVSDPSGAPIESVRVVARQLETNLTNTTETDREGRFRFPFLKVGPYEITIRHPGFTDATRGLILTVGAAFDLPIVLSLASTQTTMDVSAEAAAVESSRSQIAGTVPHAEVSALPLNGRNFLDLALLVPGVSPTNTGSTQLFAETSAVPGQGLSIGSQRNFSNNFIVDGLSANDDAAGLSGIFYGLDVVQEFQVVTSGANAELGRALGGYVNMVTRSGTNTLHGDFYGYFRNQRLNAANPLLGSKLPMTQAQYGASLGGPVIRDRTFYFANFERRDLNQSGLTTIQPANVAAINSQLTKVGYPGPLITTGLYANPVHNSNFLGKADHQFSDRDQFSLHYSLYDVTSIHSRGAGGLSAPSASANLDDLDQTIAASNVFTISPRSVNETRAQFTRSNLNAPPDDSIGPAVSISGVATFGRLSASPTARLNYLTEVVENFAHQRGSHSIRAGFDFIENNDTITFPRSSRGSYSFSSLANFLAGAYNNSGFTQTFGAPSVSQANPNAGFYAQDEWKLNSRVTLNIGVRYDLQFLKTIATDTGNVAPRLGFVWTPQNSQKTVIRGSFGLFYDRIPLRALANALLSKGQTTASLSPAQTGAPVFPNIIAALPPGVLPNLTAMDPNMQNAYSQQGSLEIERQLSLNTSISIGYQHVRGLHLIASINQNVPSCVASGTNNGCRPNPNVGNISQYTPAGDSRYDGLHISFLQRPVRWGSFRISYAYSKALDNVGEFFFSAPINNFNIWQDYGRSDDDQRHRVVFDATARLPGGFALSGILQYYSALPFNIVTGATTIQGTAARPAINGAFISRNAGTGFDFFSVNARLTRSFALSDRWRLDAIAEAFNTLNHVNGVTLNGTFGTGAYPSNPSPAFGQTTAVADPRSLQLALRVSF